MSLQQQQPLVVFLGIVCEDYIARVPTYPSEDAKMRTAEPLPLHRVGGNAANSCIVTSLLLHAAQSPVRVALATSLGTQDPGRVEFVLKYLEQRHVVQTRELAHVAVPTRPMTMSWILLSDHSGSRTVITFPNSVPVPPRHFFDRIRAPLSAGLVPHLHVEGRWLSESLEILRAIAASNNNNKTTTVSFEIEKERGEMDIVDLVGLCDIVFFSKDFVVGRTSKTSATTAALDIERRHINNVKETVASFIQEQITCRNERETRASWLVFPWGSVGVAAYNTKTRHLVAAPLSRVLRGREIVESVCAGDTFIGAFVAKYVLMCSSSSSTTTNAHNVFGDDARLAECINFASDVVWWKLQHTGLDCVEQFYNKKSKL
eukprot:PhM_4_TR7780/c0_g1_i1/m.94550/K00846/KHK; ketohexokinase